MSRERSRHSLAVLRRTLPHEQRGTHDNPGDAKAALDSPFEHEGFAQHTAHLLRGALERDHLAALHLFRPAQASEYRPPVDLDGAAAAGALRSTAVLGRNDPALLTQYIEEVHSGLERADDRFSVQTKTNFGHDWFPWAPSRRAEHKTTTRSI